ncbi:Transglutaminase-like enzyme, putative cysteine protease [Noviherbaspirillum humi]|uniref:Transglutaminase-like enzyme, putative cysteine protease n=1 Tax=Noviherbaspirillum humi TaxID=1688639 RepID=A0A239E3D7_9BURK|nr:transglutaminase family protein [Noviherbaspirillum humi]SNS39186.1 Transglutaminase-like enzyme, putative cysteine protease [Noviherbaspirillum humi]
MKLSIRHETRYRYTAPLSYTIQQLRLWPRSEPHQHVLSWHIGSAGRCHGFVDAFGNHGHILTVTGLHDEVLIVAHGEVDVSPLDQGRLMTVDGINPLVFSAPTRFTSAEPALHEFALRHLKPNPDSAALLPLAEAICGAVAYRSGSTGVHTTANAALMQGEGVCQDHAHLFLACCHAHDVPARYVSGYIDTGSSDHAESHAWVDVWVNDNDFSGWVSIDVTHARFATEHLCRLAVGRDYDSAAPIRGVRHGGGLEALSVKVDVTVR